MIRSFNNSYARAAAMGVTALASTGDNGVGNVETDGVTIYPFLTVNFSASSPLIGAIGGTSLFADTDGNYQSETAWSDGGGGISQQFREPFYQAVLPRAVQQELGGRRGIPDVSWNGDPNTPILIYLSFLGAQAAGYYTIGGTSEGSPSWAGVVADLAQLAQRGIGLLDPYAYALGAIGRGFHDVTVGNNSANDVTGYNATPGWDLTTGWGSPTLAQAFGAFGALVRGNHSMHALVARCAPVGPDAILSVGVSPAARPREFSGCGPANESVTDLSHRHSPRGTQSDTRACPRLSARREQRADAGSRGRAHQLVGRRPG